MGNLLQNILNSPLRRRSLRLIAYIMTAIILFRSLNGGFLSSVVYSSITGSMFGHRISQALFKKERVLLHKLKISQIKENLRGHLYSIAALGPFT